MPYNNDSNSFQTVLLTLYGNSAEALAQVGTVNGHEIVLHFYHH